MSTIDRGTATIWWDSAGAGDPVLLIQGIGYPSDMWFRIEPDLSARFQVLKFDNRGVGRTGIPPAPFSMEDMADDAAAVLDAAGVERAHVLGASMGGFVAQELALRHPARVRSLVLACTGTGGEQHVAAEPEAVAMAVARASMAPEEAAEVAIPFVYANATPRARIEEDFAVRLANPTSPEGYGMQLQAVLAHGGTYDRLPEVTAPTLVVQGDEDRLVNPGNADVLAERIPNARKVILAGASHILFTDQTDAFVKEVVGFFEQVP